MRHYPIADVPAIPRIEVEHMARKLTPAQVDDLVRRYLAGDSLQQVGEAFGVGDECVRDWLIKRGIPRRPRNEAGPRRDRIRIDDAAMVERYLAGESEKALAAAFGIERNGIRRRLLRAGVQPRNRSDAMYTRMSRMTPEERAELASASHDAVRGKAKTPEFLAAKALGIERVGAAHGNASAAELMLADMLRSAGRDVVHQKAIGPYNVDVASGTVAVEILGGTWHRSKKHRERLRYILDAGWDVIYIWVDGRRYPLAGGAAEYVIAHLEFRDGNPAAPRCYRVIRGGGQFVAEGSADGNDIPDIIPISDRPDIAPAEVPDGRCACGCGGRISGGRNHRTGALVRYISGHNTVRTRDRNAS